MGMIWGLLIGVCLGFLIAGLVSNAHDELDELEYYELDEEESEEVEE